MRVRLDLASETKTPASESTLPLWSTYAVTLFERKKLRGEIKSAAGADKWKNFLKKHFLPAFGKMRLDELTPSLVHAWLDDEAAKVNAGTATPSTVNTRLALLKTIVSAAVIQHSLPKDPVAGVKALSGDEHHTYTEEQPNSLTLDEIPVFLAHAREFWPQFYAMILLGFVTAQRPSHLQPLRRRGPEADVLWDQNAILVRRSHTRGKEAMNTTKNTKLQKVGLAPEVMGVLRWHVENQLISPAQEASDLLFPSEVGTMRYTSVLHPVFVDVAAKMGLKKKISPRGMRRTFQDLAREAGVHDLVLRSISGHSSMQMQSHYSTVGAGEQRTGTGKLLTLATRQTGAGLVPSVNRRSRGGGD
jgi:integrase